MTFKQYLKKRVGKSWRFFGWYFRTFGLVDLPIIIIRYLINSDVVRIHSDYKSSIFIRPGTTDKDVFNEIFVKKELNVHFGKPKYIIDAGAHIGLSAIWLSESYPDASIIAIEPELNNFKLLLKNTKKYANIKCINAGLWSHCTILEIPNKDSDNWSYIVKENLTPTQNGIEGIGIKDLMRRYNWEKIDILKMDIEGSEIEVFSTSHQWINSVKILIIELHDRFRPGCKTAMEKAIKDFNFNIELLGEKLLIRNLSKFQISSRIKVIKQKSTQVKQN